MKNILITGSNGYIGSLFLKACHEMLNKQFAKIVALDIREPNKELDGVQYEIEDIRSENIEKIVGDNKIDTVVHLAAIISISGANSRDFEFDVDVNGSKNLIQACIKHGVSKFITTSSGAAYGYWPSNVDTLLKEDMPIKGNFEIPYSYHKWMVEEQLQKVAESHPQLEQYIFRVGTILGETTKNPITDYLNKKKILCLKNYPSAFVAIWDKDLVNILVKATQDGKAGIYNVAGNGAIKTEDLAAKLGKPTIKISATLLKLAFKVLRPLRLVKYGPESVKFIQYRPVLDNSKLKEEFAYSPDKSTEEVFDFWYKNNIHVPR